MKKYTLYYVFAFILFIVSLTACLSCMKSKPATSIADVADSSFESSVEDIEEVIDAAPKNLVVSGDVWKMTFEDGSLWKLHDFQESDSSTDFEVSFESESLKTMIFIEREHTSKKLQEYMLLAVRGMKENGMVIVSKTLTEMTSNSTKYYYIESSKSEISAFTFFTMKNNSVYTFLCVGNKSVINYKYCVDYINNFTIKG